MPPRPPHLQRLGSIWIKNPIYFLTACTYQRRQSLADPTVAPILIDEWPSARERHGLHIGRFVIMPDHVHFFAVADSGGKPLAGFIAKWKEWTAKHVVRSLAFPPPLWQPRFFDHLLRSEESREEKW
jgi:REP element-mobilizing transposase RayT